MKIHDIPAFRGPFTALVGARPDLGAVLDGKNAVDEDRTSFIAWDGERIHYEAGMLASLTNDERIYVLAFIAETIRMDTIGRLEGRNHQHWSIACNIAINGKLRRSGLKGLPAIAEMLDIEAFDEFDEDEIFRRITEREGIPDKLAGILYNACAEMEV